MYHRPIKGEGSMRLIFTFAAAAALVGCENEAPDNRAAQSKPVTVTPSAPARVITASFDCDRANGQAQELVCADANLAAMDREVARLARLAAEPAAAADWAMQRDDCWKADELRHCVMATAMLKIHQLRQGSEVARRGDGLSVGPVAYSCKGIAGPVLATFVNSDPGAVAIEWGGQAIAIDHVTAASGANYEGRWNGQPYRLWTKGKEATLTVPGKGDLLCIEKTAS